MDEPITIQWQRREIISTFLFTVMVGHAIENGLNSISGILDTFSFSFNKLFFFWTVPIIFISTLIRFYIGNMLYLNDLRIRLSEQKVEKKYEASLWIFTFVIFFIQFSIMTMMSINMDKKNTFYFLLIALLCIDICWIGALLVLKNRIRYPKFKFIFVPTDWAKINLCGLIYLIIREFDPWEFYIVDQYLIVLVFIAIFVRDIQLDYFRIIK
jgi:hypothetical protein